ncbi:MAG TPA: hypothetical protein ACQGQH_08345 [Xylella sp.]
MQRKTISNNFYFLRLVAAYMVLFSHQFVLTGHNEPEIASFNLGKIGVLIFSQSVDILLPRAGTMIHARGDFLQNAFCAFGPH